MFGVEWEGEVKDHCQYNQIDDCGGIAEVGHQTMRTRIFGEGGGRRGAHLKLYLIHIESDSL